MAERVMETAAPQAPANEAAAKPAVHLSGLRKAAVLMVALGTERSAEVLKYLGDDEVERITAEIAYLKEVSADLVQKVTAEFNERFNASEYVEKAGVEFARQVLIYVMGPERAREILSRLGQQRSGARPFEMLRSVDPQQLAQLLQTEHPQTIALVVSNLPTASAAAILQALPANVQHDVAQRIATMDATRPDTVAQIEHVILDRLSTAGAQDVTSAGGSSALVEILNHVDRSTERNILDGLAATNPSLADQIKEKLFLFEDIFSLDNRSIQTVLREIEQEDLRLALKGVGDSVREVVFRNISERAAQSLAEDLELMGPVRLRDVESAQRRIVAVVRRLEEAGDVVTRRGGDDEIIE